MFFSLLPPPPPWSGKFDVPDRLFHSIGECYNSALTNPADVKVRNILLVAAETSFGGAAV